MRLAVTTLSMLYSLGCARAPAPASAPLLPLGAVEPLYGRLVTAGNHPTPNQGGTGDRLGLFLDAQGTVWGLPLFDSPGGEVQACAPPALRDATPTGTYPAGSTILGATNEPTGWRGGTGDLELIVRTAAGEVRWLSLQAGAIEGGPICWSQEPLTVPRALRYYRLSPDGADAGSP